LKTENEKGMSIFRELQDPVNPFVFCVDKEFEGFLVHKNERYIDPDKDFAPHDNYLGNKELIIKARHDRSKIHVWSIKPEQNYSTLSF